MTPITRFMNNLLRLALIVPLVHATNYSQPLPCLGFCLALDPSLIRRDDGTYFRYNTNGGIYFQKSSGTGSAGIAGPWVDSGPALPGGSIMDRSVANLWAPDVRKVGNLYIMYYSLSHINSRNSTIGYATSPTLEYGSWTDYGSIGISTQEVAPASTYNAIDPALILVNGQYYLTFGSFWNDLQIIALNANATAPATAYPAGVTQIEYQPAGSHPAEASFIYQYTPPGTGTSYFYLFWSEGIANGYDSNIPAPGAEYQVRVCRSTTVTSGYVDASGRSCLSGYGETVLASHDQVYGPGAQGVIDDACGPIMYYAYANTSQSLASTNFKWGVNYLSWPNGWPIVNGTNSDQPLGFCTSSVSSSTSTARTATGSPSSAAVTYAAAATNPTPTVFPASSSAGVCSVTVVYYVYSGTTLVPAGQTAVPPAASRSGGGSASSGVVGSGSAGGASSFGCSPLTSTVYM